LPYVDDETYGRRILLRLKRGEGRHRLVRATFHGQRGELRQRYREGQEDQLSGLGLVVNVIDLRNTLYMEAALQHLRGEGAEANTEDVFRLSPLGYKHINFLEFYSSDLAENMA
jgi:TnpA family transposase